MIEHMNEIAVSMQSIQKIKKIFQNMYKIILEMYTKQVYNILVEKKYFL